MLIENIMYFALGLLVAGLIALVVMPAVWNRAVRLTKRRIEAATPITLAEFRADKDQLRAEFALTTRRLEMNVETLRKRLAEQLSDANQKRADLGVLKAEREQHLLTVQELEARQADLQARVSELEKENTDLAQRLRMRERDLEARAAIALNSVGAEARPEAEAEELVDAEARIADAENRLNALLAQSEGATEPSDSQGQQLLADQLSMEDELLSLREEVGAVEAGIVADWQTERFDEPRLRTKLNDIAAQVSRLVYAGDNTTAAEESLFDRVQRYADDGHTVEALPTPANIQRGSLSDRLTALREIRGR
jgi:chromosome segregation ATPase